MNIITKTKVFHIVAATTLFMLMFTLLEGVVAGAQFSDNDEFIITQTITGELSFTTPAGNVSMSPNIASVTGGTATGTTNVAVRTNEAGGYFMTIEFEDDPAMQRNGGSGVINDYTATAASDFAFDTSTTAGEFAYSVSAATPADANALFRDDGSSTCGSGANSTRFACWVTPTPTTQEIVNRGSATPGTGATTTIDFQVYVPANPTPVIPTGTYTATATLTATTQ